MDSLKNILILLLFMYIAIFIRNVLMNIFSVNISFRYIAIVSLFYVIIGFLTFFIIDLFRMDTFFALLTVLLSIVSILFIEGKIEKRIPKYTND